ncbi:hypothetical protein SDC9_188322 [bioreactor metagenome]|uniref:Uncharacterized protein n=1 Tax=bioreactor metagenome TaxID=1076179 RepID=A0A645HZS4_9ZZZZ
MSVPAPRQVTDLRPGIGIQDVMPGEPQPCGIQEPPIVNQISAYKHHILRQQGIRIRFASGQPVLGLIHPYHPMIRISACQLDGAVPDTAARIEQ